MGRLKIWVRELIFNGRGPVFRALRALFRKLWLVRHRGRYVERSLGPENADKTIYLVRMGESKAGLFAFFNFIVSFRAAPAARCLEHVVLIENDAWLSDEMRAAGMTNAFEAYFEQPSGISAESALRSARVVLASELSPHGEFPMGNLSFLSGEDGRLAEYCRIAASMPIRAEVREWLDSEWKRLMPSEGRVLAVMSRGTDYRKLRPFDHPVQPSPEELIAKTREILASHDIDHIFLKTEERAVLQMFVDAFGSRVFAFDAEFFDGYNEDVEQRDDKIWAEQEFLGAYLDRRAKKNAYELDLEYLRNIYAASKCDYLLAGINGGSIGAVLLNGGRYREKFIMYLGYYC